MKLKGIGLLLILVVSITCVASAQDTRPKARFIIIPPHPITSQPKAGPTASLAQWQGSFVYNNMTYAYTMVGTNPNNTNFTTNVQTYVIPVKMVYGPNNGNHTFDPIKDQFSGSNETVLSTLLNSPVLTPGTTFPEGKTQYGDAFQRGNFWNVVGTTNTNYHLLLQGVKTLPELTINVAVNQGSVVNNLWNGILTGEMDNHAFDTQITSYIAQNSGTITPSSLPIFMVDNVYLTDVGRCCIGGYHGINAGGIAGQTYAVASAVDPVLGPSMEQPFSEDVSALSHEIAEWIDDPFGTNYAPLIGTCKDNWLLEVGDPIESFPNYGNYPYSMNGFTYHLQDLALLPYFEAPVTSFENRFTFQGENIGACNNGFTGALGSNMDTVDKEAQVYELEPDYGTSNLDIHQFEFNGSSWTYTDVSADPGVPPASLGSPIISYDNSIYNAPESFYLTADAQGNEDIEQLWGVSLSPTSLTDVANAQPAGLGSGLVGYIDPIAGTDNVFYQGTDQHIHLLTWFPNLPWSEDKRLATAQVAAFGSALSGHITGNSEELFYIGINQHIYELWRWSKNFDFWHCIDVTSAIPGSTLARGGSPLAGFYDGRVGTDAIFYVGTDEHVHELLSSANWSNIDVTLRTGAPNVPIGSMLAAHVNTIANSEEVFFVTSTQAIQELWSFQNVSPTWHTYNMFTSANGGPPINAEPGSLLGIDIDTTIPTSPRDELYYMGTDNIVHELWSSSSQPWTVATP